MRGLNLLVLACSLVAPGFADTVLLSDGTEVEGKIILETQGGPVFVQRANKGLRIVQRDEVREIQRDETPATYVRFHQYHTSWSRLEVLTRTLENADKTQKVALVGAIHVGDMRYYGRIQRILDRHDVVLYEGVGPNQDRDLATAKLPTLEERKLELARPAKRATVTWTDASNLSSISGLQRTMAETLDLTYQKNGVDYSHSWWFSADVTMAQLQSMYSGGGDPMFDALVSGLNPAKQEAVNAALGRALAGAAKGVLGPKPMQLVMKEACATFLAGLFVTEPGVGATEKSMSDFERALILGRNRVVMDRFKEVSKHPQAKTIAIFYGAAHNPDLEAQLKELGYTPVRDEWLPAWVMEQPEETR